MAAGIASALLYAGQFSISRWSLQHSLTPWDLAAVRFTVAGVIMLPVLLRHGVRDAGGLGWGRALVLSTCAGGPYTLMLFTGLSFAPAAHGAVIITGGTPVITTALMWLWLGKRPGALQVLGLGFIVLGLVLVSWTAAHGTAWIGDLILIVPALMWGVLTMLLRHWRVDPARVTAVAWVVALGYLPFYLAAFGPRALAAPPAELAFQAVYQGLGVAIAALALYGFAIRALSSTLGSLIMPMVPVFAALLAIPVLGEIPTSVQLAGMAGVCAGMVMVART